MRPEHLREHIVEPVLLALDPVIPYSEEAVALVCMTAAHESNCGEYLRQIGMEGDRGAFGIYQHELSTLNDMNENYLSRKQEICAALDEFILPNIDGKLQLKGNHLLSTALCRIHYYRVPQPLPKRENFDSDVECLVALSEYAKKFFNTSAGKATADDYLTDYINMYGEEL